VVDAEDVLSVVQALVQQGIAHVNQVVIQGGSAGGFTVLNALVNSTVFAAGASYYGVADMLSLASDTHDFESRYLDSLLGPLPQCRDLYIARSPLTHVSKMSAALILFQGSEDKVRESHLFALGI
jgi:dipeptidyl aminopeptidase/acylaminoacyl peptidase